MIILITDILTALAAYVFIIYGLFKAVEDKDDMMILSGIFIQIFIIGWIVDAISRLTEHRVVIMLLIPLAAIGIYPVIRGIMNNQILPADLQIKLRSPVDNKDGGRFIPMLNPVQQTKDMRDDDGGEWEES